MFVSFSFTFFMRMRTCFFSPWSRRFIYFFFVLIWDSCSFRWLKEICAGLDPLRSPSVASCIDLDSFVNCITSSLSSKLLIFLLLRQKSMGIETTKRLDPRSSKLRHRRGVFGSVNYSWKICSSVPLFMILYRILDLRRART